MQNKNTACLKIQTAVFAIYKLTLRHMRYQQKNTINKRQWLICQSE